MHPFLQRELSTLIASTLLAAQCSPLHPLNIRYFKKGSERGKRKWKGDARRGMEKGGGDV